MIMLRLKLWWVNFLIWKKKLELWWWTRGMEARNFKPEKPFVRKVLQDLRFAEINTESDGDDRISVAVSILIPPSFDHPKYDRYANEFEKSMGMLVEKCLALSEKYKRNDFTISAFTIEATLYLGKQEADVIFENGRPDWLKECLKTEIEVE